MATLMTTNDNQEEEVPRQQPPAEQEEDPGREKNEKNPSTMTVSTTSSNTDNGMGRLKKKLFFHKLKKVANDQNINASNSNNTPTQPQQQHPEANPSNALAPFNPTNDWTAGTTLRELFDFGNITTTNGDTTNTSTNTISNTTSPPPVLFDLGCGDGRLLRQAVQEHDQVRGVGVEFDEKYVVRARQAILDGMAQQQLTPAQASRLEIRHADLTLPETWGMTNEEEEEETTTGQPEEGNHHATSDDNNPKTISDLTLWDDATCIYIYLLPKGIQRIRPFLEQLIQYRRRRWKKMRQETMDGDNLTRPKQKLQIVACTFQVREWQPVRVDLTGKSGVIKTFLYEFTEGDDDENDDKDDIGETKNSTESHEEQEDQDVAAKK